MLKRIKRLLNGLNKQKVNILQIILKVLMLNIKCRAF